MEGNVQKMREALRHCIKELSPYCDGGARIDDVLEEAKSALTIPLRNCDVGTAEKQTKRLFRHHQDTTVGAEVALAWSQMPYEEGDNDGK